MMDKQQFRTLLAEDTAWLAQQRQSCECLLENNPDAQTKYLTPEGKLGFIRYTLERNFFSPTDTFKLQGLGIILGDVFKEKLGMEWMMVEDDQGISPCLIIPGTSIVLYPQTMISKRVEQGKAVDIFEMFNAIAHQVNELRASGV